MTNHHGARFQRVDILNRQKTEPSELGERKSSHKVVGTIYAKISPVGSREYERAKSFAAEVSHRIVTRYTPLITTTSILCLNNRRFHVNGILNIDDRNQELLIYATEKLGER